MNTKCLQPELFYMGLGRNFAPPRKNNFSMDLLGISNILKEGDSGSGTSEQDSNREEDSSDDVSLISDTTSPRRNSIAEPAELAESQVTDENCKLDEDGNLEEQQNNGVQREYSLEILGKDENGEDIYKVSDMYIPEDPALKKRLHKYIRDYLMPEKNRITVKDEEKIKRRQKINEMQTKLREYYNTHKPKIYDELDLWLSNNTEFHAHKRDHPSMTLYSNVLEEEDNLQEVQNEGEERCENEDAKKFKDIIESPEIPNKRFCPEERDGYSRDTFHIYNWTADVIENLRKSMNRINSESNQKETSKNLQQKKKSIYLKFADAKMSYLSNSAISEAMQLEENIDISEARDSHWGTLSNTETPHASYKKILDLQKGSEPIFTMNQEINLDNTEAFQIEVSNHRDIPTFASANLEVMNGNWTNAVSLSLDPDSDRKAKKLLDSYKTELLQPYTFSTLEQSEENHDLGLEMSIIRAERKESLVRSQGANPPYCRPPTININLGTEAQESFGEISRYNTRVSKSKIFKISHSRVAQKLIYNKINAEDPENFHRKKLTNSNFVRIIRQKNSLFEEKNIWPVSFSEKYLRKKHKSITSFKEIINSHKYFKNKSSLNLISGKICLLEYIDEHPIFLNNFGMASKLLKYVYANAPKTAQEYHMSPHGIEITLNEKGRLPLVGQIDVTQYKGLTILENNMYRAPVFYQKISEDFFLLVKHKNPKGIPRYILREIDQIFTVGQEEPKMEMYNPQSRQFNHLMKERAQKYVYKILKRGKVNFLNLSELFPEFSEQIFKKFLRESKIEEDKLHNCAWTDSTNKVTIQNLPEKNLSFGGRASRPSAPSQERNFNFGECRQNQLCYQQVHF